MPFTISTMLNPSVYDHSVSEIELIETHISWVILTGEYAYKIKKPINYGFLDFSTLEKRHRYCEQELLLNRRLAPSIYLDVVAIAGTSDKPVICDSINTSAFEYAVKMAQFPQSAQLDHKLALGGVHGEQMDAIAHMIANFHLEAVIAAKNTHYGNKETVYQPITENFKVVNDYLQDQPDKQTEIIKTLKQWSITEFKKLKDVITQRKYDGFVRECHGDMHLRNLVWLDNKPMAFDCIEFNANLRWIDVISEIAFFIMDLQDRKHPHLANQFLNSYLEITGDYAGVSLLPFYLCYRAMVRAKVDALRLQQATLSTGERQQSLAEFASYIELAATYTRYSSLTHKPKLIIMRGVSASGKSTVSQLLLNASGAIRIRSDIERKRLFSIPQSENASSGVKQGVYSEQASQQTYEKLAELATEVIQAGYTVIIDAAFLKQQQRKPFQQLAHELGIPYIILQITAPVDILRQRIVKRTHDVSDADLQVLEDQLAHWQDLQSDEIGQSIIIDTDKAWDVSELVNKLACIKT